MGSSAGTRVLEQLNAALRSVGYSGSEALKVLLLGRVGKVIDHRSLARLPDRLNSEQRWTRLVCDATDGRLDL